MFTSTELARRIEMAECGLVADGTRILAASGSEGLALPLAGGLAAYSGADSPFTKVVGLGFAGLPSEQELAQVELEFAARGAALQVELATLAQAGLAEQLTRRGYLLVGFEDVLGRDLVGFSANDAQPEVSVSESSHAELENWIELLVTAFAAPDGQGVAAHEDFPREALTRVMRALAGVGGLRRFLARRKGAPAGAASLRIDGTIAQLCGAGTLPAQRRRGVQGALLAHRLALAAGAGARLAVMTTLPGSKSQENALRQGFVRLYTRAILRRES